MPLPARRYKRSVVAMIVLIGLLAGVLLGKNILVGKDGSPGPIKNLATAAVSTEHKPEPEVPKRQVDTSMLQESLHQIIKKYPYNTSVSVIDLNSNSLVQTGDSYPFIAASTTKILTSLVFLSEVEAGQTSLDARIGNKTAEEQLKLAINQSDNEAWAKLNDYIGRDKLALYAKEHGLQSYDVTRNTITSNDMAQLITYLWNGKLLNETHTKFLLGLMQNTNEERFIPTAVPSGMAVYHKAGYLADRVHDVGVIDNGSAPFVIVIYSKSYTASYDYGIGQKLFKEVTAQVIDTFK